MRIIEILEGLDSGSIQVLELGHNTNSLRKELKARFDEICTKIHDLSLKIEESGKNEEATNSILLLRYQLDANYEIGDHIFDFDQYCYPCDSGLYVTLIDEHTIGYITVKRHRELSEDSPSRFDFKPSISQFGYCPGSAFERAGMLKSKIKIPTGELVFQNKFENEELYGFTEEETEVIKPQSINSILGRNQLMQHLGKKGIGYGQMSNMEITLWSNQLDEIIIGNDIQYELEDLEYYVKSNKPRIKPSDLYTFENDIRYMKAFTKMLEEESFVKLGDMYLETWRWMCADASVLDEYKEKRKGPIIAKVSPGTYEIEHYFDFCRQKDFVYSRIKMKSNSKKSLRAKKEQFVF